MESSREARMQQRMRGAQRHQVQDVSFGPFFTIPEPEPEAPAQPSSPAPRTTPNSSAKRRRLDSDPAIPRISPSRLSAPPLPEATSAPRSSKADPYQLPEGDTADEIENLPRPTPRQGATPRLASGSGGRSGRRDGGHTGTPRASGVAGLVEAEEVGESPADAPGSGQRRRVRISGAASSSARLHDALLAGEDTVETTLQDSSPLTRKSRLSDHSRSVRSTKSAPRRSTRLSGGSEVDVSPEASVSSPAASRRKRVAIEEPASDEVDLSIDQSNQPQVTEEAEEEEEEEVAQEIDDNEAARRLGRKRPRRSVAQPSSELGSEPSYEEPAVKRRRKSVEKKSTKKQKQPKAQNPKAKPTTKRRRSTEVKGPAISIEVQRFVLPAEQENGDDNSELQVLDRKGVNAIDVLSQMCEEIIRHTMESLHEAANNAQNTAEKKEIRTKLRALEAFLAELKTRFLEHTIALDTLHSLQKRVRAAQRQKLDLRKEILEIRAQRDQIALRMDAARIKHEEDSKTALNHIHMSSAMHDIDLAIEAGLGAPELTAKEIKAAPPANLDLLMSRISSQVCNREGGVLTEIKNFNAFLERAAVMLEAR